MLRLLRGIPSKSAIKKVKHMNKYETLKKFGAFSLGSIIGAIVNFITTPTIAYFITPEEYGRASMYTVALSIIQLVIFLGMDQAYGKKYYEADDKSRLFVNAITPSVVLVILCEIFLVLMGKKVGVWLFGSSNENVCMYALMLVVPALVVEKFYLLSIRMSQRGKMYSAMTVLLKLLTLITTVSLFLIYERSFRSVIIGSTVAQIVYAFVLCIVQKNEVIIDIRWVEWNEIKDLLKFGLPLVPTVIIGWVLTGMDKVMLRTLSTYNQLGLYGIAAKVAGLLTIIQTCFTTFWVPLAYQWNSEKVSNKYFIKVSRLVSFSMSIVFATILLLKDMVFMIFPDNYRSASNILPFLLFTPIMYTISEVTVMGIYFNGRTGWTIWVSVISATINLVLNRLLIPVLGPIGAALATGFSYIVFFWSRTMFSRRLWFEFPLEDYAFITLVLLADAFASTFIKNPIVYIVNTICVLLLCILYWAEIKELQGFAKGILNAVSNRDD